MMKVQSYRPIVTMINTAVELMEERNKFINQLLDNENTIIFGENPTTESFFIFIECLDGYVIWFVRKYQKDSKVGTPGAIENVSICSEQYYSTINKF